MFVSLLLFTTCLSRASSRCRGPASRLSACQPFPQLERAAGFTGFTVTPLTPGHAPDGHAPSVGPMVSQPRPDHAPPRLWLAVGRYTFGCDWLRVTSRQTAPSFVSVFFFLCFVAPLS